MHLTNPSLIFGQPYLGECLKCSLLWDEPKQQTNVRENFLEGHVSDEMATYLKPWMQVQLILSQPHRQRSPGSSPSPNPSRWLSPFSAPFYVVAKRLITIVKIGETFCLIYVWKIISCWLLNCRRKGELIGCYSYWSGTILVVGNINGTLHTWTKFQGISER